MERSSTLFNEAKNYIPGGVNSPVRAFQGVGGEPIYFERGEGAYLYDVDGNAYIDYVGSWGPMILGHSNPFVVDAVRAELDKGLGFGAPTEIETSLAKKICQLMPSIELVRMVSSGTEATMSAIRLARGYTKRDKIVKFEGCYHGHSDSLLVKAGSGALTLGVPTSPGVPSDLAKHTLVLEYNNLDSVKALFSKMGEEVGCIIVEPVAGNMNCIPPKEGFLQGLRKLCDDYGSVLIFDEVMTGFRLSKGGASEYYGVTPDMVTLGKIIGGGLPVGAFGGKKEIMDMVAPVGPVYQAGTLSGNPIAMGCGYTLLKELNENPSIYSQLEENTAYFEKELRRVFDNKNLRYTINRVGSMISFHFDIDEVNNFDDACNANADLFKTLFHGVLKRGVYFAPSAFESLFLSTTHTKELLDSTIVAIEETLEEIL